MAAEPATNWYRTRRHWSHDLGPWGLRNPSEPGRRGHSLCSTESNPVDVWDQEAIYALDQEHGRSHKAIDDLPECKKCARLLDAQISASCEREAGGH
jgi:hypothetical protein